MLRFWQTDPRLTKEIQTYGCAFLDAHYLLPDDLEPSDINERWQSFVTQGILIPDDLGGHMIGSWAKLLGGVWSEESVVKFPFEFARVVRDQGYACAPNEREIIKWWLSNVEENHFTVGDGHGVTVWDSMNRPDVMKAYATFVQKVIVKVG